MALGEELAGATCSTVYTAGDKVLKVPHAGSEERDSAWAAQAFSRHGGIEILKADEATGALLMPRLGLDLAHADLVEEEKVRVCAELILQLRETKNDRRALDLATWFEEPEAGCHPLKLEGWKEATYLLETSPDPVLLHGDLHHHNILKAPTGWQSIDPKGMSGDPAFEPCAYMRNPIGGIPKGEALVKLTRNRLSLFAKLLPYAPRRIWGWSFAQTVVCGFGSPDWAGQQWALVSEALWEVRNEFLH
ncbi:MAG: aminoglycoside phosphotransferase family protein [Fimbriimonas sp.]